ncbi:hypothetical protein D3C76_793950 [compost metagenome]
MDGSEREERIAALLTALEQVWSDLVAGDVRPELYLEGLNGKLNPGIYWGVLSWNQAFDHWLCAMLRLPEIVSHLHSKPVTGHTESCEL